MKCPNKIVVVVAMLALVGNLFAQDNILPMFQDLPQSRATNPAIAPQCAANFGIPTLNIKAGIQNTGFSWNDIMVRNSRTDSLSIDLDKLASSLSKDNLTSVQTDVMLLGFGLTVGKNYASIEVSNKTRFDMVLPSSLLDLRFGNWDFDGNRPIRQSISDINLNGYNYMEIAFGFSRQINDAWRAGITAKYLAGIAGIRSNQFDVAIDNYKKDDKYVMNVKTKAEILASVPLDITYDEDGYVDDFESSDDFSGNLKPFKNGGFSIDMGALWQPNERLQVGASIIDLGFIKWKSATHRFVAENDFEFSGINIDQNIKDYDYENENSYWSNLQDSISEAIKFKHDDSGTTFKTKLRTQIVATARYSPNSWFTAGAVSRMFWVDGKIKPHLSVNAAVKAKSALTYMLSAGVNPGGYVNVGTGLQLQGGPLQFYILTDDAFDAIRLNKARAVNVRFGFNILLGRKSYAAKMAAKNDASIASGLKFDSDSNLK